MNDFGARLVPFDVARTTPYPRRKARLIEIAATLLPRISVRRRDYLTNLAVS